MLIGSKPGQTAEQQEQTVNAFLEKNIQRSPVSTVSIPLKKLPAAKDVVLPVEDLLPGPNSILHLVYPRLSEPVPHFDSSTSDYVTGQPTFLTLLGYTEYKKVQPVEIEELVPITRPLQINDKINEEIWEPTTEYDCMRLWGTTFKNYEPMQTVGKYAELIGGELEPEWGLPLFGKKNNALKPVLQLVSLEAIGERQSKIIFHYVAIVCFQFYLMERSRFVQIKLEKHEPYVEADLPSFFFYFPRYDSKKDPYDFFHPVNKPGPDHKEWIHAAQHDLAGFARKYDYVTLWYCVMCHLLPKLNHGWFSSKPIEKKAVDEFVTGRLFNNFFQMLHTSHFWPPFIEDYDTHCINSASTVCGNSTNFENGWMERQHTKNYISMKTIAWCQYSLGPKPQLNNTPEGADQEINKTDTGKVLLLKAKIPIPHAHFHFGAEQPVFQFPMNQPLLLDITHERQILEQCKLQDQVYNQLAKCLDKKALGELDTALNACYRNWKQRFVIKVNKKQKQKQQRKKASVSVVASRASKRQKQHAAPRALVLEEEDEDNNDEEMKEEQPVVAAVAVAQEDADDDELGQSRPQYHEPVTSVNLVRARYSFVITKEEKTVCTGLVPHFRWNNHWEIEPETSVTFIAPRVWLWLVESGIAHEQDLKKCYKTWTGPLDSFPAETSSVLPVFDYVQGQNKIVIGVFKNKVNLRRFTMDFDAVKTYFQLARTKKCSNLYIAYYGLIVLLSDEKKAAAQIVADCKKPALEVLKQLQEDYKRLRSKLKKEVYSELRKEGAIDSLLDMANRCWDRQTLALMSPETWNLTFSPHFIKNYIKKHLPSMESFQMEIEDNEGMQIAILRALIQHLASPHEALVIPLSMSTLKVAVPVGDSYGPYLSIEELNDYLIGLFEPLFVNLSYFFQHMFPSQIIQHSNNRAHENLLRCRQVTPIALNCVYSLSKQIRSTEFIDEINTLVKAKKEAEVKHEEFYIPEISSALYSVMLYHMKELEKSIGFGGAYKPNPRNCSEKDRGIENLRENLIYLTASTIYTTDQQLVVRSHTNRIANMLTFCGTWQQVEPLVREMVRDLSGLFEPAQMGQVVYKILNDVASISSAPVKAMIDKFKKDCFGDPDVYRNALKPYLVQEQRLIESRRNRYPALKAADSHEMKD